MVADYNIQYYDIAVRGVQPNDSADHEESPVAVFLDGALSLSLGIGMSMLTSIGFEVLRGPQGTLVRQKTQPGAVAAHTTKPGKGLCAYVDLTGQLWARRDRRSRGGPSDDAFSPSGLCIDQTRRHFHKHAGPIRGDADSKTSR